MRKLDAVLEIAPDATLVVEGGGYTITFLNRRAEELFGYRRAELLGQPVEVLVPEPLREAHREHLRAYRGAPGARRIGVRQTLSARRKDGSVFAADIMLGPIEAGDGLIVLAMVRDIAAQQLDELYNRAPCGYHSVDRDGRIVRVNDTELSWLGFTREEVIGRPLTEILSPAHRAAFPRHLMERGEVKDFETAMLRKDGSLLPVLLNATAITDADGQFVMGNTTVVDLTERKRADEVLRQSEQRVRERTAQLELVNQDLEAFSYSVSHDLRTPLQMIGTLSGALQEECTASVGAVATGYLDHIRANVQWMGELIDALLRLAVVTRAEMQWATVDLSHLARAVAADLLRGDPARRVAFVSAPGLVAQGDPQLLRIVMENLLANAWKYTSQHPTARVEFGAMQRDGATVYYVRDDGAGFDVAYAAKLFAPFQRLHSSAEFEGTGVGLATVQRIVRRHGGMVWAEGTVERGATFYFTLGAPAHR